MIERSSDKSGKKRIVVLGGGFGGVYAAIHLEKLLARQSAGELCSGIDHQFLRHPGSTRTGDTR
jgi:glycine/D-amino acid oxidase-like deaminating enzyme